MTTTTALNGASYSGGATSSSEGSWYRNGTQAELYIPPFPRSNAAIPVPAISGILSASTAASPWVPVKRKRNKGKRK